MERRLTSILALDVVGYSRLMGKDEVGKLAALKQHRKDLLDPKVAQYRGRTVKLMGDGALMEFASVVDAVAFAVDVQVAMRARNAAVVEDRRIVFRIGINIGDIIVEDGDIFGDGVNVAARLETLAEPGGVCLARNVFNQVKGKLDLDLEHLGERAVKNIAEPVSTYRVVMNDKAERLTTAVQTTKPRRRRLSNSRRTTPRRWYSFPRSRLSPASPISPSSGRNGRSTERRRRRCGTTATLGRPTSRRATARRRSRPSAN